MKCFEKSFSVFLCGDVMSGRGIDQILPFSCNPQLYEFSIADARDYVLLAEQRNSKINYPVSMDYIWGDALSIWREHKPVVKIINLETSITQSDTPWLRKEINYRMHPGNVEILRVAGIDVCTLANNHILDWGYAGLKDTMTTLKNANIQFSGVGNTIDEASKPAICELNFGKRVLVFAAGAASSGVPVTWSATMKRPGVYYLDELNADSLNTIANNIKQYKKPDDLVIFSIHWGSNWGYQVSKQFQSFAHALIDEAHVDVVFGHSSHHFRPMEIYHGKLILYGCGDFINDYEGISGYDEFRSDLALMYFIEFDYSTLQLNKIMLVPMRIKNFKLQQANEKEFRWILDVLNHVTFDMRFSMSQKKLIYTV